MNRFRTYSKKEIADIFIRGLAVIGFIAILFGGLWGTVQVVKLVPSGFSSLAAVGTSLTSIFIPSQEISEETLEEIQVDEPAETPTEETTTNTSNTEGELVAGEQIDQIFPIFDTRTVGNGSEQDLVAQIIAVGVIGDNNEFLKTDSLIIGKRGAVKFHIQNIGGRASDNWTFNAVLPSFPLHIFHSNSQQQLGPGDRVEFTLGFDQVNKDLTEGVITINIDPTGSLKESNKNNNIAQITVPIVK